MKTKKPPKRKLGLLYTAAASMLTYAGGLCIGGAAFNDGVVWAILLAVGLALAIIGSNMVVRHRDVITTLTSDLRAQERENRLLTSRHAYRESLANTRIFFLENRLDHEREAHDRTLTAMFEEDERKAAKDRHPAGRSLDKPSPRPIPITRKTDDN